MRSDVAYFPCLKNARIPYWLLFRPVSTHHSVKKVQFGGDLEVQEMCFYIPAEHQVRNLDKISYFVAGFANEHVFWFVFMGGKNFCFSPLFCVSF